LAAPRSFRDKQIPRYFETRFGENISLGFPDGLIFSGVTYFDFRQEARPTKINYPEGSLFLAGRNLGCKLIWAH